MNADQPRFRLAVLGVVVLSLFVVLLARLWHLQVLTAPEYRVAAERNIVRTIPERAPRGRILDRDGTVLIDNRASGVVAVDRPALEEAGRRREVLDRLAGLLAVPASTLAERLEDDRASPYAPVPLSLIHI